MMPAPPSLLMRWFFAFAAVLIGAQVWAATDARRILGARARAVAEHAAPAAIEVTIIRDPACSDCATFDGFLAELRKLSVRIAGERMLDASDATAQTLIATNGIAKLPALVLTGEVGKRTDVAAFLGKVGALAGDTFVAQALGAPYIDLATHAVIGRLRYTKLVDASCAQCYDVGVHDRILTSYGIRTADARTVDIATAEGRALVRTHAITAVPAFFLEGDLDAYPGLAAIWPKVGTRSGSVAVFRTDGVAQMGKYRELPSRRIVTPKLATPQS